jgi:alpha-maltose-1-phosphate synthase
MDVLVHTSRAEPLGLVIVEAMASSLPVVAFADGGVPEIVLDGETGRLAAPGDLAGLTRAVTDLLQNPTERARMGTAGRQRACAEFSVERMVRRTEAVYDELRREGNRP